MTYMSYTDQILNKVVSSTVLTRIIIDMGKALKTNMKTFVKYQAPTQIKYEKILPTSHFNDISCKQ